MLWLVERWQTLNLVSILLWPLSLIYCFLAVTKRWLYLSGVFRSHFFNAPIIVVGNITVGGSGKTPFVIWLGGWLKEKGLKPGIVLRGYGGQSTHWPRDVDAATEANEVGDEAVLLAKKTNCPVVAAPDRVAAVNHLLSNHDCNVVISDDGMQHYRMGRDFEISVIDGKRRYGNGLCLPAGPLREPRWRGKLVDMTLVNGPGQENELSMQLLPKMFRNLSTDETVRVENFSGKKVHAVAGIGNPERFFNTLEEIGLEIIRHPFPDHYHYQERDICFKDGLAVIMTDKDAVKCKKFADDSHWILSVEAKPDPKVVAQLNHWIGDKTGG